MSGALLEPTTHLAKSEASRARKEWTWRGFLLVIGIWAVWQVSDFRWSVVIDAGPYLLQALGRSWLLTLIALTGGFALAIPLAIGRVYGPPGIRQFSVAFIEVVRSIPELLLIFWVYFTFPELTGKTLPAWWAAIASLIIIAAAYLAEVVRGGLNSIPAGQREASISSGLSAIQTLRYVVLPQAIRNMVPAFVATVVTIFKTTSLVSVIGVIDFFRAVVIVNNAQFAPFALYLTLACGYFICCYSLTRIIWRLDPKYVVTE
jgi:His/Glu/Gln/Arg/opine family amino acid ABC transporter permease subunit